MALPTTAGKRCEPATVLEAPWVTRKYRGTENIICYQVSSRIAGLEEMTYGYLGGSLQSYNCIRCCNISLHYKGGWKDRLECELYFVNYEKCGNGH